MDLVCLSHSPLMRHLPPRGEAGRQFFRTVECIHDELGVQRPDVIVVFGPDHFNGFKWDVMPPFCIGLEAESTPDWGIPVGKFDVPKPLAEELACAIRAADVDIAVSQRMRVDHGFTIPLELLCDRMDRLPVVPIFINCVAPPLPSCRRARLLGEAVGRFLAKSGLQALIVGSGGISHDPPHAAFDDLAAEMRELMLGTEPWGHEHETARQRRVIAAAKELADHGGGPCLPPDAEWDRTVLDLFHRQTLEEVDRFDDEWITQKGGRGGHEIRCWIAAFSALGAARGRYRAEIAFHGIVPEWITGMAVMRASA